MRQMVWVFNFVRAAVLTWAAYQLAMTGGLDFENDQLVVAIVMIGAAAVLLWSARKSHLDNNDDESFMRVLLLLGGTAALVYFTLFRSVPLVDADVRHEGYMVLTAVMIVWFTVQVVPFVVNVQLERRRSKRQRNSSSSDARMPAGDGS